MYPQVIFSRSLFVVYMICGVNQQLTLQMKCTKRIVPCVPNNQLLFNKVACNQVLYIFCNVVVILYGMHLSIRRYWKNSWDIAICKSKTLAKSNPTYTNF